MGRTAKLSLLAMVLFLSITSICAAAEPGRIQFCESLTDKLEPVNPGDSFPGPAVSWIAASASSFGKPTVIITIYKDTDGVQSLLTRREMDVNPAWNNLGLRNMTLENPGKYTIVLSRDSGEEIAKGSVNILQAKSEEPPKPEEKVGGTLETLFNKYNPKK